MSRHVTGDFDFFWGLFDTDLLTHPGDVGGGCLDLLTLVQHAPVEVDLRTASRGSRRSSSSSPISDE